LRPQGLLPAHGDFNIACLTQISPFKLPDTIPNVNSTPVPEPYLSPKKRKPGINTNDIPFVWIKPLVTIHALPLVPQLQPLPLNIIHISSISSVVLKDSFQFSPANWATAIFRARMALD
jgi:hypothetical protein